MRTPKIGDIVTCCSDFYKIISSHPREDDCLIYELEPIPGANIFREEGMFTVVRTVEKNLLIKKTQEDRDADNYLLQQTDHS